MKKMVMAHKESDGKWQHHGRATEKEKLTSDSSKSSSAAEPLLVPEEPMMNELVAVTVGIPVQTNLTKWKWRCFQSVPWGQMARRESWKL